MVTRSRTLITPWGPGFTERKIGSNPVVHTDQPQTSISELAFWKRCDDTSGLPLVDHPLTITERDNRGLPPLKGMIDQGGGSYIKYENANSSWQGVLVTHLSTSIPSVGARATTLMARTNPSREEVSVPNFIHELKDLPGMYKDILEFKTRLKTLKSLKAGGKSLANYNLSVQMGWLPMIRDIRKLVGFQALADKRVLELNRLYSSRGLKRRMTNLYSQDLHVTDNFQIIDTSLGSTLSCKIDKLTRQKSWGTLRWVPTAVPKDIGHQALGKKARQLVFGLDHLGVDAVQAWNALPFTWLADWFGNFGEWLQAHRNDVPARLEGPCNIMTLTETYEVWTRLDSLRFDIKGASGVRILRTKQRAQSSGSLSVTLPLLNGRQWSILSSLALQRLR